MSTQEENPVTQEEMQDDKWKKPVAGGEVSLKNIVYGKRVKERRNYAAINDVDIEEDEYEEEGNSTETTNNNNMEDDSELSKEELLALAGKRSSSRRKKSTYKATQYTEYDSSEDIIDEESEDTYEENEEDEDQYEDDSDYAEDGNGYNKRKSTKKKSKKAAKRQEDREIEREARTYTKQAKQSLGDVVETIIACRYHPDEDKDDKNNEPVYQYLVKYKERSYRHCKWVDEDAILDQHNGRARMSRFHAKMGYPEDFEEADEEYFNPLYTEVDRILDESEWQGQRVYLIKWKVLPYSQRTWEFASEIETSDKSKVAAFKKRNEVPSFADRHIPPKPAPSFFQKIEGLPFNEGYNLRSYQLEGLNWLIFNWFRRRNTILADEMGLGKTIQSTSMLYYLYKMQHNRGPYIIIAPLSTIEHWKREIETWTDMNAIIYHGDKLSRELLKNYEFHYYEQDHRGKYKVVPNIFKFNVLITTYEMCLKERNVLCRIPYQYLIVDEGHRLKNANSKLLDVLRSFETQHKTLLTGTPLQNNIQELWTLLNYLQPEKFANVDLFMEKFGDMSTKEQVEEVNDMIQPYLLRRLKEDVEKSIPAKEEIVVEVVPTTVQKTYYRAIIEHKRDFLCRGVVRKQDMPKLANLLMQVRKVCNHPFLINGAEETITKGCTPLEINEKLITTSSKLLLVDKLLKKLFSNGHKVLIFSQMVRVLDILEDYLNFRKYKYVRLDGSVRGDIRQEAIDKFNNADNEIFVFLISTRAGGVGINLTSADTVIIYDSDWNPQNDIQAQARCHRIGQKKEVRVYRLLTKNTREKEMFERANKKLGLDRAVLNNTHTAKFTSSSKSNKMTLGKDEISTLLKHGAMVAYADDKEEEQMLMESDIDSILQRSSTVMRFDASTQQSDKGISHFAKATFKVSEDDIDIDDKDFWLKVLPDRKDAYGLGVMLNSETALKTQDQVKSFLDDLKRIVDKTIEEINNFKWSQEHDELSDVLVRAMYSEKLPSTAQSTVREWLETFDKSKSRTRRQRVDDDIDEEDDELVENDGPLGVGHKRTKGGWYKTERDRLHRGLVAHGWGEWKLLQEKYLENKSTANIHGMSEAVAQEILDILDRREAIVKAQKAASGNNDDDDDDEDDDDDMNDDDDDTKSVTSTSDESGFVPKPPNFAAARRFMRQLLHVTSARDITTNEDEESDSMKEEEESSTTTEPTNKLVIDLSKKSEVYPVYRMKVILPEEAVLKFPFHLDILEKVENEEEDAEPYQLIVRHVKYTEVDIKKERAGAYCILGAPGYRSTFTVRLSCEGLKLESDTFDVSGQHPQLMMEDFQGMLFRGYPSWIKKLKFFRQLATVLEQKPDLGPSDIPDLTKMKTPTKWWDAECDYNLLKGIVTHGYARFPNMKLDPTLCFATKIKAYVEELRSRRDRDRVLAHWPSTTKLNSRLSRIVILLLRQMGAIKPPSRSRHRALTNEWNKSEVMRVQNVLNQYGLLTQGKSGIVPYAKLITKAKLAKNVPQTRKFFYLFIAHCKKVGGINEPLDVEEQLTVEDPLENEDEQLKATGAETEKFDVDNMTYDLSGIGPTTANRLVRRVSVLFLLNKFKGDNDAETRLLLHHVSKSGIGLPKWWSFEYDIAMLKCLSKDGFDVKVWIDDPKSKFHGLGDETRKLKDSLLLKRLEQIASGFKKARLESKGGEIRPPPKKTSSAHASNKPQMRPTDLSNARIVIRHPKVSIEDLLQKRQIRRKRTALVDHLDHWIDPDLRNKKDGLVVKPATLGRPVTVLNDNAVKPTPLKKRKLLTEEVKPEAEKRKREASPEDENDHAALEPSKQRVKTE